MAILEYFGLSGPKPRLQDNTAFRALPAPWYFSPEMYELERRAIFSNKWMLITHRSRLAEPGDWLRYEVAGFGFLLTKDRKGDIRAHHNICRHRAYPIVTEDKGRSKILACKYHGWSYGLNGQLAKAPKYDELQGFDKSKNGLLPIHCHVDRQGYIWINLDAKEQPDIPWNETFDNVDQHERTAGYDCDGYQYDHTWEMTVDVNWKILADNYNECYHCPTSHPDLPSVADLESYSVNTRAAYIQHDTASTPEQIAAGLTVSPTYFYPNASINITPHFFFIQRFIPAGPLKTTMRYEVYRNKSSSEEDFQLVNQMYKRVMTEDKHLCNLAQQNINAGVFVNGELHPRMEKGALYFQKLVRESVEAHHEREKALKRQIWPARQQLPDTALVSKRDVDFCSGLACQENNEILAW